MSDTYNISLPQFEGPFDLLLFFIERDELDIYDIPIFSITNEFLAYIKELESMNIDLASEFILVASTLMRIKAKLLLPRKELDEAGNEIDPREELVNRLIEYKRYKSVLSVFSQLEHDRFEKFDRLAVSSELKSIADTELVDIEMESLTLFKLMKTYQRLLTKLEDRDKQVIHQVVHYPWTLRSIKEELLVNIQTERRIAFGDLLSNCTNKVHAVFHFLAILELIQLQQLNLTVGEGMNSFWIEAV